MPTASYKTLLQEAQPQVIRDETAYRRALRWIDKLMKQKSKSAAEERLLELLAKLVNDYEESQDPTPDIEPSRLLRHLMDAGKLTQADVAKAAGIGRSTINDILSGRRGVSVENAFRLAQTFALDRAAFLYRCRESSAKR
jgi:HTH-type transcriptional regulator/antitoxin HigA